MSPLVLISILSLVITMVLYTIVVWKAFRTKTLTSKHLIMLWVGFAFDVVATTMMGIRAGGIQDDLHSIIAFAGMFGMLAVMIVGTLAYSKKKDALLSAAARWSVVPWLLWAGVFFWGFAAKRG